MERKGQSFGIKNIRRKLVIIIIAVIYFGLLAFTMYQKMVQTGITGNLIKLAIVITAFAAGSYIMFFYSEYRLKARHVTDNTKEQLEITKKQVLEERSVSILFLIAGVILMVLTVL